MSDQANSSIDGTEILEEVKPVYFTTEKIFVDMDLRNQQLPGVGQDLNRLESGYEDTQTGHVKKGVGSKELNLTLYRNNTSISSVVVGFYSNPLRTQCK